MDRNAIRLTKLFCRRSLLEHILRNEDKDIVQCLKTLKLKDAACFLCDAWNILRNEDKDIVQCLKTLKLKDAACFLCDAWNEVSSSVLQKCWTKLTLMTEWNHDDLLPLAEIKELMEKEKKGLQTVYEMVQDISHSDKPTERKKGLTNSL
ncbi:hypothetical protein QE152_g15365 [Popillia japonica]|uniref:Uncharacterized protein n=1 Tax=Popillia japonica TaxID=7064 RepID=A0AAW1L991_POPJA